MTDQSSIELGEPGYYRIPQLLVVSALTIPPALMCGLAIGAFATSVAQALSHRDVRFLVPALGATLIICLYSVFRPLMRGGPYVARLARRHILLPCPARRSFLVGIRLIPRLRHGLRAVLENSDDIGFLCVTDDAILLVGDQVRARIPFESVHAVKLKPVGWRRAIRFAGGAVLTSAHLPAPFQAIEVVDRAGNHMFAARANTLAMFQAIRQNWQEHEQRSRSRDLVPR